jgi:hypothetical protein
MIVFKRAPRAFWERACEISLSCLTVRRLRPPRGESGSNAEKMLEVVS